MEKATKHGAIDHYKRPVDHMDLRGNALHDTLMQIQSHLGDCAHILVDTTGMVDTEARIKDDVRAILQTTCEASVLICRYSRIFLGKCVCLRTGCVVTPIAF